MATDYSAAIDEVLATPQEPAPPPEPASVDYSSAIDSVLGEKTQKKNDLATSVEYAVGMSASEASEIRSLSNISGLPFEVVRHNQKQIRADIDRAKVNTDSILNTSPITANFLADPTNMALARDHYKSLQEQEGWWKNLHSTIAISYEEGISGNYFYAKENLIDQPGPDRDKMINAAIVNFKRLQEEREELTPEDLNWFEEGLRGGIESLAIMLPGFAASAVTANPTPMLAIMGGHTFGMAYAQARADGLDRQTATSYALVEAFVEVATEKIPVGKLLDVFTSKEGKKWVREFGEYLFAEGITEQFATVGQSANAVLFGLDEGAETFEELIPQLPRRMLVTAVATAVATTPMYGVAKAGNRLRQKSMQQDGQNVTDQKLIDELHNLTNEMDAEAQRDALNQMQQEYGEDSRIFIPADDLAQALEGVDPETLPDSLKAALSGATQEKIDRGDDVELSVSDYLTDIINGEQKETLVPLLREIVRLRDNGLSMKEAKELAKDNEDPMSILRGLDNVASQADLKIQSDAVIQPLVDQMVASGRMGDRAARINGSLISAYLATHVHRRRAKGEDVTVEQVWKELNPQVQGPGVVSDQDNVLYSQETGEIITDNPNFQRWFGRSQVPIVYHATPHSFDAFARDERDQSLWGGTMGFHFGTQQAANDRAGDIEGFDQAIGRESGAWNVMPVYLNLQNPLRMDDMASRTEEMESEEGGTEEFSRQWENPYDVALTLLEDNVFDIDTFEEAQGSFADIIKALEAQGYDGIVYENSVEDSGNDSYIAFHLTQIKSVFNQGTFDPNDPNILNQIAEYEEATGQSITDTPAFKRWFGQSQVRDESGAPLVMYHGTGPSWRSDTTPDITVFDTEGSDGQSVAGAYFSKTSKEANKYTKSQGEMKGAVYPVYLSLQNPASRADYDAIKTIDKDGVQMREELMAQGFDGFIDELMDEVVVFDSTQIKSVFNRGTFDPSDPNILNQSSLTPEVLASTIGIEVEELTDEQAVQEAQRIFESVQRSASAAPASQVQGAIGTTVAGTQADESGLVSSVIRTADGKLRLVHRGSRNPLTAQRFDSSSFGKSTGDPRSGLGVFLHSENDKAGNYGPYVESFYLNIQNPYIVRKEDQFPVFDTVEDATKFRDGLKSMGFDGIVFDMSDLGDSFHFVAFDPEQVIRPDLTQTAETAPEIVTSNGPVSADAEVATPPQVSSLYQAQNIPEWKDNTIKWMKKNGYSKEEIDRHLASIEAQFKLVEALGPHEIEMLPQGAGLAPGRTQGPIRTNQDPIYKITFDASAMCVKRLEASATASAVEKKLGRPLTASERMALVAMFKRAGKTAPCVYCYVEAPRSKRSLLMGQAQDSITGKAQMTDAAIAQAEKKLKRERPEQPTLTEDELNFAGPKGAWSKKTQAALKAAREEYERLGRPEIDPRVLTDPDFGESEVGKKLLKTMPNIFKAMNMVGAGATANLPKLYEEYSGQILNLKEDLIQELNGYAGLRFFSSSDFQAEHVVDLMQAFVDMSLRGVKAHSYTKVPMFVDIFGNTGMKIQTSIFAQRDADGKVVMDDWQGMDWDIAKKARKKYQDVGTILVATDDEIVQWALSEDWVDYIIPFHYSGLEKKFYGTLEWEDFTSTQNETPIVKGEKAKKIRMHEVTKGGGLSNEEATRKYLTLAMERKIYPVFPAFVFKDVDTSVDRTERNAQAKARWAEIVEQNSGPDMGININDSSAPYTDLILSGEKTIETRDTNTLDPYIGKRVGIVRTGKGKAQLVGYVTISGKKEYSTKKQWDADVDAHKVPAGSQYDWTKPKIGYVLTDQEILDTPVDVNSKGIVARKLDKPGIPWDQINPNYFKLRKDYARSDTPFNPVTTNFDVKAAKAALDSYLSGAEPSSEVDGEIADNLIEMINEAEGTGRDIGVEMLELVKAESRAKREQIVTLSQQQAAPQAEFIQQDDGAIIRLLESSNLSSFAHEAGHLFLNFELATGSDDTQAILDFLGADSIEDVIVRPGEVISDQKRAYHEKFAVHWEAYLMEGKAPSAQLRSVFARFTSWMVNIYRDFMGLEQFSGVKVDLNPEIRAVFDRMLATDDEIKAIEAENRYGAEFFDSPQAAGMTPDEWEELQNKKDAATAAASQTLMEKVLKQLQRTTEKWWKDEKRVIMEEMKENLAADPLYLAEAYIRENKIDREWLKIWLDTGLPGSDSKIPKRLSGLSAANGVDPDLIAPTFGYADGAEMMNALYNSETLRTAAFNAAEVEMIRRHGDILNDGTLEAEAQMAAHNEERAKALMAELRATKGSKKARMQRAALKAKAEEAIAGLKVSEIRPDKYHRAEVRAARNYEKAVAKGDKEAAAKYKQQQLANFYLFKEATKARAEVEKALTYTKKFSRKSILQRLGKSDPSFLEQIQQILGFYSFAKSRPASMSVQEWKEMRNREWGDSIVLDDLTASITPTTADRNQMHYKSLTMSELRGVVDTLKNIDQQSINKYNYMIDGKRISFDELRTLIIEHLDKNESTVEPLTAEEVTERKDKIKEGRDWRSELAKFTDMATLMLWLDNNERAGLMHRLGMQPLNVAQKEELDLIKEVGEPIAKALQSRSRETVKRHSMMIDVPFGGKDGAPSRMRYAKLLMFVANLGTQSNLEKLARGEGLVLEDGKTPDMEKIQAIVNMITHKEDIALVDLILKQTNKLYEPMAEVAQKQTGIKPPKEEAIPIHTPFGILDGGYYPMGYDHVRAAAQGNSLPGRNQMQNEERVEMLFMSFGHKANADTGSRIARTNFAAPIDLSLDVLMSHLHETVHYITHYEAVKQLHAVFNDPAIKAKIIEKVGLDEEANINHHLNAIAMGGSRQNSVTMFGPLMQRLRLGLTLGIMGFKASTGLMQFAGLSNAQAEIGGGHIAKAIGAMIKTGGNFSKLQDMWNWAAERSTVLKHRIDTMDREIMAASKALEGKDTLLSRMKKLSMMHIALIQTYTVDLPSWYAAFEKKKKDLLAEQEGKDVGDWGRFQEDIETRAARYADWVVENVQGSGANKDLANALRDPSPWVTQLTMFMTFFAKYHNRQRTMMREVRLGQKHVGHAATWGFFAVVMPVLWEMLIRGELPGWDDDEEDVEEALANLGMRVATAPFSGIPFVRDVANAAFTDYSYNQSPLGQLFTYGLTGGKGIVKAMVDDEKDFKWSNLKSFIRLFAAYFQVPGSYQLINSFEAAYDMVEEGADDDLMKQAREFVVTGPDKEKK